MPFDVVPELSLLLAFHVGHGVVETPNLVARRFLRLAQHLSKGDRGKGGVPWRAGSLQRHGLGAAVPTGRVGNALHLPQPVLHQRFPLDLDGLFERVAVIGQIAEVHLFERPAKQILVGHREIEAVQWDLEALPGKGALDVGMDAFRGFGDGFSVLLVADAVFQFQDQAALFFGHPATLGVDHEHAFALRVAMVVDQDVVEGAVGMLLGYTDGKTINAVVEDTLSDVQGRPLFGHRIQQGPEPNVGCRPSRVAEPKRTARNDDHAQHKRPEDAEKGHARGFHGGQFAALREVAHGHDGGDEHSQRKGQVDQACGGKHHQLEHHPQFETLADQIVGVHPQKLHVQDEQRHGKRDGKRPEESLQQKT